MRIELPEYGLYILYCEGNSVVNSGISKSNAVLAINYFAPRNKNYVISSSALNGPRRTSKYLSHPHLSPPTSIHARDIPAEGVWVAHKTPAHCLT